MQVAARALFTLVLVTLPAGREARAQDAASTLDATAKAMGVTNLTSIEYRGSGSSYNFGQAINVASPWRHLTLKKYVADINYATPAMREEMSRTLLDGTQPFGGFQQVQFISGGDAWNISGDPPAAVASPATVLERQLQIWLTPVGFLKAAIANHATVKTQGPNKMVAFVTSDRHKVEGTINGQNLITKTETWIDIPVLGDMPIVTTFSNYARFGDVKFPTRILQTEGGYPVLALAVGDVKPNGAATIDVPANVRGVQLPPANVNSEKIADGVWFLAGGTHHSVLVEFSTYVAVIEAPLDENRSNAVIAEVHRLVPNKPIKYVVNTHNHFDHLGGVRTFAAEGAIVIAPAANVDYYRKVFLRPHTLSPDRLSLSGKEPSIEGVRTRRELSDGAQTVELFVVPLKSHSDAMIIAYVPKEKLLVEADAYVPGPLNAPASAKPDPYFLPFTLDLYDRIRELKLDVGPIAPLHGRMTSWAEMTKMIGKPSN
jgi:glyoxylase-like metal-dependent hydrolase (beta-lactamase superfamily II)